MAGLHNVSRPKGFTYHLNVKLSNLCHVTHRPKILVLNHITPPQYNNLLKIKKNKNINT